MSRLVMCVMSEGTATELSRTCEWDHLPEPEDPVERVLRTHVAPVTGLEEEVARILSGSSSGVSEESERG
jgi:hypothetical protein